LCPSGFELRKRRIECLRKPCELIKNSFARFCPSWIFQALQSFNDKGSIILAHILPGLPFSGYPVFP
jgi:hypothetical protein